MKIPNKRLQRPPSPSESLHNILYHSHLHLTSQPPAAPPSSSSSSSLPCSSSSSSPPRANMLPHIADLASDAFQVQTASTIQYRRAHLPPACSEAIAFSPPHNGMRHLRHPSNLPLYTPDTRPHRNGNSNSNGNRRRLRDSLKPLFQIFTAHDSTLTAPLEPHGDPSRKGGSKTKILQEASANSLQREPRGESRSSLKRLPTSAERPTRYYQRQQSSAAIMEELKCEGVVGSGGRGGPKTKKRKGRDDAVPDLEKPLPPLVPCRTRRNSEERYWAGVADDIARRASMMS